VHDVLQRLPTWLLEFVSAVTKESAQSQAHIAACVTLK
jgi:hypothetical protein